VTDSDNKNVIKNSELPIYR